MKLFCKGFVLYFLALVLMPCADIHAYEAPAGNPVSGLTKDHDDCPHEEGDDFCSPFCICNCCGQIVLMSVKQRIIPEQYPRDFNDAIFAISDPNWENEYLDRLFHPPRI